MLRWDSETYHPIVILPEEPTVLDLTGSGNFDSEKYTWSIGKYDEVRTIYTSDLFSDGRTVHVGLDIGGPVGTPILSFFDGSTRVCFFPKIATKPPIAINKQPIQTQTMSGL